VYYENQRKRNGCLWKVVLPAIIAIYIYCWAAFRIMDYDPKLGLWLLVPVALIGMPYTFVLGKIFTEPHPNDFWLGVAIFLTEVVGMLYLTNTLGLVASTFVHIMMTH